MYVHGELLFPDYVAVALLLATLGFLLSITAYGFLAITEIKLDLGKVKKMEGSIPPQLLSVKSFLTFHTH